MGRILASAAACERARQILDRPDSYGALEIAMAADVMAFSERLCECQHSLNLAYRRLDDALARERSADEVSPREDAVRTLRSICEKENDPHARIAAAEKLLAWS